MDEKYRWERLTASRLVSPNPVTIGTVIVMAHDSKHGKITLYDGESTNDPQIIEIKTASGESKVINFQPYLRTNRGLYVDFTQDTDEVLIVYDWGKE